MTSAEEDHVMWKTAVEQLLVFEVDFYVCYLLLLWHKLVWN